jgi:uncharacterized DUF497 family protein
VHTLEGSDYEWDPEKAAANLRKHGIDFADAALPRANVIRLISSRPASTAERKRYVDP